MIGAKQPKIFGEMIRFFLTFFDDHGKCKHSRMIVFDR